MRWRGKHKLEPMMKSASMVTSLVVGLLACSVAGAAAPGEGSVEKGQSKSAPCVACHGPTGNSPNGMWPNLAGQHPLYIVRQLQAFKSGVRNDPTMMAMAAPLSDEDMQDLAAYYSAQAPTGLEADPAKVREGERLYRGGDLASGIAACAACHGPSGHGNPAAVFPAISGQHASYVVMQLKAYRSGTRKSDQAQNQMMRNIAALLTDPQIEAVAAYVQGLR
jgi:cytochrome c553